MQNMYESTFKKRSLFLKRSYNLKENQKIFSFYSLDSCFDHIRTFISIKDHGLVNKEIQYLFTCAKELKKFSWIFCEEPLKDKNKIKIIFLFTK